MDMQWHDWLGALGVGAIVISYFLLQVGRIPASSLGYSLANALGSAMVLLSLVFEFNMSAFALEVFWLLISLIGLYRWWLIRHELQQPADG